MLASRKPNRRQIILVIAEKRDRSSNVDIATVLQQVQHQNALVYWLTYSPFLTPFTNRQKTVGERKKEEDRGKDAKKDAEVLPPDMTPGSLLSIFTELAHRTKVDAASLLSRSSGGNTVNFLKQKALEETVQAIAAEVHRQYIISFQPRPDTPGFFHSIRVEVRDRPELHARTRAGYWTVQ
jgi:hypothetical protein